MGSFFSKTVLRLFNLEECVFLFFFKSFLALFLFLFYFYPFFVCLFPRVDGKCPMYPIVPPRAPPGPTDQENRTTTSKLLELRSAGYSVQIGLGKLGRANWEQKHFPSDFVEIIEWWFKTCFSLILLLQYSCKTLWLWKLIFIIIFYRKDGQI